MVGAMFNFRYMRHVAGRELNLNQPHFACFVSSFSLESVIVRVDYP